MFESPAVLEAQLRAATTNGHVLVVVEDAVRAEANAIFRVMNAFRGTETVTFLVDARGNEWQDPSFQTDARLEAYRTESVETVSMPVLDERECMRLVEHFQETTGQDVDVTAAALLQGVETETADTGAYGQAQSADLPDTLLLVLHRFALRADPLVGVDSQTPATLTGDVQQTYEALRAAGDTTLDVGVLVNLLNVSGMGVKPPLVYALATDGTTIEDVHDAMSTIEGKVVFEGRGGGDDTHDRVVPEPWSMLFVDQLLCEDGHGAAQRFGRCVTALLALADAETRRTRIARRFGGATPSIDRIASAPAEWADATIERVFYLGLKRPRLAPLYGTTEYTHIRLPECCSPWMTAQCAGCVGGCTSRAGSTTKREASSNTSSVSLTPPRETPRIALFR